MTTQATKAVRIGIDARVNMTSEIGDLWSAIVRKTRLNPKATAPKTPTQPIFLKALTTSDP